jgi:hypothetical protein
MTGTRGFSGRMVHRLWRTLRPSLDNPFPVMPSRDTGLSTLSGIESPSSSAYRLSVGHGANRRYLHG